MFTRKRADMRTIKTLLVRAEAIAHELGDQLPGAEHLLLSALELPDGTAQRAFDRIGAGADGLKAAIAGAHAQALSAVGIDATGLNIDPRAPQRTPRLMGFSPSGRAAFQSAAVRARSRKPTLFTGADVVAGVCDQSHGSAARALTVLGVDRLELRAAAEAEAGAQAQAA